LKRDEKGFFFLKVQREGGIRVCLIK